MRRLKVGYGQTDFDVSVQFSERTTMTISVLPDCSIVAVAPNNIPISIVRERILKRARWIKKQQYYFAQFQPRTPARKYVSGETHLYLGRQYRLKIIKGSLPQVKLKGQYFWATCKNESPIEAANLMDSWYKKKADIMFKRRLELCIRKFPRAVSPTLDIKAMKNRWGSMSKYNKMTLNLILIQSPVECIDYVIIHELCHLEQPNHGKEFWRLLSLKLPDWQRHKDRLERILS